MKIKRIGKYGQRWQVSKHISDQVPVKRWEDGHNLTTRDDNNTKKTTLIPYNKEITDNSTNKQKLIDMWIKARKKEKIMKN